MPHGGTFGNVVSFNATTRDIKSNAIVPFPLLEDKPFGILRHIAASKLREVRMPSIETDEACLRIITAPHIAKWNVFYQTLKESLWYRLQADAIRIQPEENIRLIEQGVLREDFSRKLVGVETIVLWHVRSPANAFQNPCLRY